MGGRNILMKPDIPLEPLRMKQLLAIPEVSIQAIAIQGAGAAIGAAYLSMNQSLKALAFAIIFDLVSTAMAEFWVSSRGGLHASEMLRMFTTNVFVFTAMYYLGSQPALMVSAFGMDIHIASAGSIWYVVYAWVHIAQNLTDLGIGIPPFMLRGLKTWQAKLNTIGAEPSAPVDPTWDQPAMDRLTGKQKETV